VDWRRNVADAAPEYWEWLVPTEPLLWWNEEFVLVTLVERWCLSHNPSTEPSVD
jgi:hypothetical protein